MSVMKTKPILRLCSYVLVCVLCCSCCVLASQLNQLSQQEKKQGFKLLFDGKSMEQWRNYKSETIRPQWQIIDETMVLTAKGGRDLITKEKFGYFDLRLEYTIAEKGNSGIMFRVVEETDERNPWRLAPEYQLYDSFNVKVRGDRCAGALYGLIAAAKDLARKPGEWNQVRILLEPAGHNKDRLRFWLNDKQTVDIIIDPAPDSQWSILLESKKSEGHFAEDFFSARTGPILLQDHGSRVAFRNIRIRECSVKSSMKVGDIQPQKYEATWDSLKSYKIPKWYEDAKFGIFIHWGVYSVPAFGSEWYPRHMYIQGTREFEHHAETYGPQRQFGYKDFIAKFGAEKFNAAEWSSLFRKAGAKYVVPVAEHHDGFPMYNCSHTEWCAAKMGPKRDIIGELAAAVRQEGLVFGVSSHRAENWWYYGGGRLFDSDVNDHLYRGLYGVATPGMWTHDERINYTLCSPSKDFLDDWLARCAELVDKYQPQLFWFDWWIGNNAFEPYRRQLAAYYYNRGAEWGKGVAINYKYEAFPAGTAVLDIERGQLAEIRSFFWQTDTAVSKNSWGYIKNHDYKTVDFIVDDLIDIVSKNGALLLNIGPRPDGTIPEHEQEMLLEIGRWLALNGEAIYGTRPWKIYGEGPTKVFEGMFQDTKRQAFTGNDIRFTTKGDALYAIAMDWPKDGIIRIKSLSSKAKNAKEAISSITLLGSKAKLKWDRDSGALTIHLPDEKPCDYAYVFKIE